MAESATSSRPLPERPNLDHLKKQAKELLEAVRAGEAKAVGRLQTFGLSPARARLHDAQLVIAREHGFASWRKLKAHVDERRQTLDHLLAVIRERDVPALKALLTHHPEWANGSLDENHHRPLHHAAGFGDAGVAEALVAAGADVEPAPAWFHTPLSWATTEDNVEVAEVLLAHGASLDLWCAAGLGKLEAVRGFFDDDAKVKAGASTVGSTRFDDEGKLLPKPPTNPIEIVSDALYIAARNGHAPVVAFLLDHGADINFRGYDGGTPLFWAAARWPAVQERPAVGQRATVELLLSRGADPDVPDREGHTALEYVRRVNNKPIAELLQAGIQ